MLIVHIQVKVIPDGVDAFREATVANARASIQEPGIARFDVVQQADDPTRFVLIEIYRTIRETGDRSDETAEKLNQSIEHFKGMFNVEGA